MRILHLSGVMMRVIVSKVSNIRGTFPIINGELEAYTDQAYRLKL